MTYLRAMFTRLREWWHTRGLFVIADPRDNSVTLSRRLFDRMRVYDNDEAKVFVFRLANAVTEHPSQSGTLYAFALNPRIEQPTQLADIQYNSKHKCIGFESLCPSVGRIFYDYGITHAAPTKLSIMPATAGEVMYYIIVPPHAKHH